MLPYFICALLLILPVAGSSMSTVEEQAQAYRKRIHPPLVRVIRSLEDELQSLPKDNSQSSFSDEGEQDFPTVTESSDIHFERNVDDFSKPADAFVPTSVVSDSNDGNKDFMSNPAATEYQLASTSTPQFPDTEKTVSPIPDQSAASKLVKIEEKSTKLSNVIEEDDEGGSDESDGDADDDDDDVEDDENDDDTDDDDEEEQEDRQHPKFSTEAPAYFKDVYLLAKEEKHDKNANVDVPGAVLKPGEQDSHPKIAEDNKQDGHPASAAGIEKQNVGDTTADPSDLSPEQDIDETLSDFERQQARKSDDNTNFSNKNNNNQYASNNENITRSEIITGRDYTKDENDQPSAAKGRTTPVTDQYNYNAENGDTSLEIDITSDDENQESTEVDASARSAERYEGVGDSGNASLSANVVSGRMATPTESDKMRLEEEILERLKSEGMEKRVVKKSMMRHSHPNNKLEPNRDSAENEDILQLMIRVAEDPKDWEEIRELLEKIQFDEMTLRKAKSRLRALAKQQRLKNIRKNKTKGHDHVKHKLGKILSRNVENDITATSKLPKSRPNSPNSGKVPSVPNSRPNLTNKTQNLAKVTLNKQKQRNYNQMPSNGKGGYIKVNVFPTTNEKVPSGYKSGKFHQGNGRNRPQPSSMQIKGDDFAIEKPVTVIGERSRVDPVEKELVEASTNQRIRELQREKAMLAAAGLPTDEMEEQLMALTKLERRLKEHWHQKQKLLQKIHEKDQRRQAAGPSMW